MKKFSSLFVVFSFYVFCLFSEETSYIEIPDESHLTILNPDLQKTRTVAKIQLPNHLEAYLISDTKADFSAAAVSIPVGSWNNPQEHLGMAHFLEHMLFKGTKTFPEESAFIRFITDHVGSFNAFTGNDKTVYAFSIEHDSFPKCLNQFSHFFIDPLFDFSCVERELHAVDEEHSKNRENDFWREYEIIKELANPEHPIHQFSTGNLDTLSKVSQNELSAWYQSHYSANLMKLVIYSRLPMETLKQLTCQFFANVPDKNFFFPAIEKTFFLPSNKASITYIAPIKNLKIFDIYWELPRKFLQDNSQSAELVAYALTLGSQSLEQSLKAKNLISNLGVEATKIHNHNFLFNISIFLTEDGLAAKEAVLKELFTALANIRSSNIPSYIFEERKHMLLLNYLYQSREDAFDFVMSHAANLLEEPIATYPNKILLPDHYDSNSIQEILSLLTPENAYYFLIADPQKTQIYPNKKEKWNGGEYITLPMDETLLSNLKNSKTSPHITLPSPNPFIPNVPNSTSVVSSASLTASPSASSTDSSKTSHEIAVNSATETPTTPSLEEASSSTLTSTETQAKILSSSESEKKDKEKDLPVILEDSPQAKCVFVEDHQLLLPKLSLVFRVKTPLLNSSPNSYACGLIYIRHVEKTLKSLLSTAAAAGLSAGLSVSPLYLNITIDGYAEKAPLFFETLLKSLSSLPPLPQEDFNLFTSSLSINIENIEKDLPVAQGKNLLYTLLQKPSIFYKDIVNSLHLLCLKEYQEFQDKLFEKNYLEGTISGSLSKSQAEYFLSLLKSSLGKAAYPLQHHVKESAFSLQNIGPFHIHEKTPLEGCGILLAIDQGLFSFESFAAQQILSQALVEPFFTSLRSKQAIAYIARSWSENIKKQLFQIFAVQSSSKDAKDLTCRFDAFIEDFLKDLPTQVPLDRFNDLRNDLIKKTLIPPKNYQELTSQTDDFAFEKNDFDWDQKYIKALETLSYENFLQLATQFLSKTNQARLTVSVEGKLIADLKEASEQKITVAETPLEDVKMLRFK